MNKRFIHFRCFAFIRLFQKQKKISLTHFLGSIELLGFDGSFRVCRIERRSRLSYLWRVFLMWILKPGTFDQGNGIHILLWDTLGASSLLSNLVRMCRSFVSGGDERQNVVIVTKIALLVLPFRVESRDTVMHSETGQKFGTPTF
jgi:hypothetical protein